MATTVTIGGADATDVTVTSATSLTATVPAGTAGDTVDVVVSTSTDTATLTDGYTYQAAGRALTDVSPDVVYLGAGTKSVYTGTELNTGGGLTVFYTGDDSGDGPSAGVYVSNFGSPTTVNGTIGWALTDGGTVGETVSLRAVDSQTFDPVSNLPAAAVLTELPAPTDLEFTPATLQPGGTVTVTGAGFIPNVDWRILLKPATGNVRALNTTVVSETQLTGTLPTGTPVGDYTLLVAAAGTSSATLLEGYVYTEAGPVTVQAA